MKPHVGRAYFIDPLERRTLLAAVPSLLKDLAPGEDVTGSAPVVVYSDASTVYAFGAAKTNGTRSLWKIAVDGSQAPLNLGAREYGPSLGALLPDGRLIFGARNTTNIDTTVWITDGTVAGTRALDTVGGAVTEFSSFGGRVYFQRAVSGFGRELWSTDGTTAGTSLFKDLVPGANDSAPGKFRLIGNVAYFFAKANSNAYSVWRTDGTASGTIELGNTLHTNLDDCLTVVNGITYVAGNNWITRTDGTVAGTSTLAVGTVSSIVPLGGSHYFARYTQGATRLYRWNGQTTGSTIDVVTTPGTIDYFMREPFPLRAVNDRLVFSFGIYPNQETWVSNSTVTSWTRMPTDGINEWAAISSTRAVYSARKASAADEIWSTDGTLPGTFKVAVGSSLRPGLANGTISFWGSLNGLATGLYTTDGTVAGTTLCYTMPVTPLSRAGSLFVFAGSDAQHGSEPWITNGTPSGTQLLAEINHTLADGSPRESIALDGFLYFTAHLQNPSDDFGTELWRSDGTAAGTTLIKSVTGNLHSIGELVAVGHDVFFAVNNGNYYATNGNELWKTNGSAAGTTLVRSFGGYGDVESMKEVDGRLVLNVFDDVNISNRIWRSDGTAAGTVPISNYIESVWSNMHRFGDYVAFVADQGTWNDGPPDALKDIYLVNVNGGDTRLVTHFGASYPGNFAGGVYRILQNYGGPLSYSDLTIAALGDWLYFDATSPGKGTELWRTNVAGDAQLVKDINPSGNSTPLIPTAYNGKLYFTATDGVHGRELWVSDGTAGGTQMVVDLVPGASGVSIFQLDVGPDGLLHFIAGDASNALTWYVSDGTAAGTRAIKTVSGVLKTSFPYPWDNPATAFVGNTYYAVIDDGIHGAELWQSDGTAAGTFMTGDIEAGSGASSPTGLLALGSNLVFAATRSDVGRELFVANAPFASVLANGTLSVIGTSGDDAIAFRRIDAGHIGVSLNGSESVIETASFSSVSIAGVRGNDAIEIGQNVSLRIAGNLGATAGAVSIHLAAGANVTFTASQQLSELSLSAGAAATITMNGSTLISANHLTLETGAVFDLNDNDMRLVNTPAADVRTMLLDGRIISTAANESSAGNTALGLLTGEEFNNSNGGPFDGQNVLANDLLIKYTYFGDVDFNGRVDVSDYNLIDFGFVNHLSGWANGDVDGNGSIDASDYNLIDYAFSTQVGTL